MPTGPVFEAAVGAQVALHTLSFVVAHLGAEGILLQPAQFF